jgi:hypothetical protein
MLPGLLEAIAYAGWWFREALQFTLWWVFVGYPEVLRELDKRGIRPVLWNTREETDEQNRRGHCCPDTADHDVVS